MPFNAGEVLTAESLALAVNPPFIDLRRSTNQTVTTSAEVAWQTSVNSNRVDWSSSVNPDRIYPQVAGRYLMSVTIGFADKTDNSMRQVVLRLNGASTTSRIAQAAISGASTNMSVTGIVEVNGTTDYLSVLVTELATGTVDVNLARLSVVWVSR